MIKGGGPTIYVSDMDRAVTFYTETLGFSVLYRGGDEWTSIDAGNGLTLGLHGASERGPRPGAHGAISVGFNVGGSIDDVVTELKARGVVFRGPIRDDADGGIRLAFFGDPDGNDLYLCALQRSFD